MDDDDYGGGGGDDGGRGGFEGEDPIDDGDLDGHGEDVSFLLCVSVCL